MGKRLYTKEVIAQQIQQLKSGELKRENHTQKQWNTLLRRCYRNGYRRDPTTFKISRKNCTPTEYKAKMLEYHRKYNSTR